jgi:pyruvate kinase
MTAIDLSASSTPRTKIVATIGPACDRPSVVKDMIDAGMNVARINLAHGGLDRAIDRYQMLRTVAAEREHAPIGILIDLPGPKLRTGQFPAEGSTLTAGQSLRLVSGSGASTSECITIGYPDLVSDVRNGDRLAFGDGQVVVEVQDHDTDGLVGVVLHGGRLQGRPGVAIPSESTRLRSPTAEDLQLLEPFVELGVDMVAVSFVRAADDLHALGTRPHPEGPLLVAKIETKTAIDNLIPIIQASGAVMIARGDLGIDCPIEELPHLQKHIIRTCIEHGRPMITATQMLESMIQSPMPTRAEASDIANAVLDGTSAVMLSAETAIGHDPVLAVQTMARIAARADDAFDSRAWGEMVRDHQAERGRSDIDVITEAVTEAAWQAALEIDAAAIICWSGSGHTVRAMARFRPRAQILGLSPDPRTVRQLSLSWGAIPIEVPDAHNEQEATERGLAVAREAGYAKPGDTVVVVSGSAQQGRRISDSLRLVRVT